MLQKSLLCLNSNLISANFNVFLFCLLQKPKRTFFGRNPKWKTSKASSLYQWYAWPALGRGRLLKFHPVPVTYIQGNSQRTSFPLSRGIRKSCPIWKPSLYYRISFFSILIVNSLMNTSLGIIRLHLEFI